MTDKEMAEEYSNEEVPFDTTESGEKLYTENDLKQAYLAGLKVGRQQQWHKVADGDLPNDIRSVWTNVGHGYHDAEGWWGDWGRLNGVVAWCEPKYIEKEA